MFHIGVDLAWGARRPTGLAVIDDDGRLVHLSAVRTDEEILVALAPYVEGECLVAIDAPLIVTNPTGNRPAEAALNRDFARFDAGAHPSNTGKPEFRDTPRGASLCQALGLDMNPRSGRRRRAIEVYPHPATVSLFRLGPDAEVQEQAWSRPGRPAAGAAHPDGPPGGAGYRGPAGSHLSPADDPGAGWAGLRAQVETATRKSQLRVVEDQVDAVVCAYVALFAARRPADTTTYGDFESGYIVTPALPADLSPSPRPPQPSRASPATAPWRTRAGVHPESPGAGRRRRPVPGRW